MEVLAVKDKLERLVGSCGFQSAILGVIVFNALLFGLQTSPRLVACCGGLLNRLDQACLVVFVIELVLKLVVYNRRFCRDAWNIFDFLIVAVSFVPDMGMFSSVRIFRVLRVFKLISGVHHMRVILAAILKSIPGIAWAGSLLLLIYYVYGILATNLFGNAFPDWFGSLGKSTYSLFQIMTLESWSMGIARPVIAVFPFAWIFFVSYILITTFIVLNIVVGIVLNSIGDSFKDMASDKKPSDGESLEQELKRLREQLEVVERLVTRKNDESKKDTTK